MLPLGSPVPVGSQPYSVALGDVNGDGKLDLVTANFGSNNVTVLLNQAASPATKLGFTVQLTGATPGVVLHP